MSKKSRTVTQSSGERCPNCTESFDSKGAPLKFVRKWGICVRCYGWVRANAVKCDQDPNHWPRVQARLARLATRVENEHLVDAWMDHLAHKTG